MKVTSRSSTRATTLEVFLLLAFLFQTITMTEASSITDPAPAPATATGTGTTATGQRPKPKHHKVHNYVFGYGSLICPDSRKITNPGLANKEPLPVIIQDVERVWSARTVSGYTAMG